MLSFGFCDQVGKSDKPLFFKVTDIELNRLVFSVSLCPKVITLSGFNSNILCTL